MYIYSVLQCVAVCCSVLQCVEMCLDMCVCLQMCIHDCVCAYMQRTEDERAMLLCENDRVLKCVC